MDGEIVQIEIDAPQARRSPADFAGMWADDETYDEFLAAVDAYRQSVDSDPTQP